ncbi:SMP-30/gluconolactonase/LRE family protein [Nocardia sp. CA2R105]|uniref:SMP-30/gluconolactonase/LRE family protein n=1 Tax=Nocardia coffeae TaxID=2873381 RepID=UPI001CA793BD|nr:SMP-30/gluconolactonase/LRE family protein [Nocardia coffeae]MBY8856969.1 SMP-30/gluconolactonase/LRE family protein [Nocardia coffeae]
MNRTFATLAEWIDPSRGQHRTVPPMDAGLRPNRRLDEAQQLLPNDIYEPDDIVIAESGSVLFSSGRSLFSLRDGEVRTLAELPGPVGALVRRGSVVIAAVEGTGLVAVDVSGTVTELCTDPVISTCVTDLAVLPDGALIATVGSRNHDARNWSRALVQGDRSGLIVRLDGSRARVRAQGLGWPSGIEMASDTEVLVSLSFEHRIELRSLDSLAHSSRAIARNLPVYPGRLAAAGDGWWVAAPYIRNRVTEMLLDEPAVIEEMVARIDPEDWFVPRLRCTNPYTDTMQMGQLRVLGVVKPWAPARSCGVVLRIDRTGRVVESAHARVDSKRHGVTGVAVCGGRIVAAANGFGNLLHLAAEKERGETNA